MQNRISVRGPVCAAALASALACMLPLQADAQAALTECRSAAGASAAQADTDAAAARSTVPSAAEIEENARIRAAIFDGTTGTPRFADYPVARRYSGPIAALDLSDRSARMFRTRLSAALQEGEVVFAGEYTLAGWGCGTSCFSQTFVSKRTGRLLTPSLGGEEGPQVVKTDPQSALVVAEGTTYDAAYEKTGNFAYFYVLEGNALKLIRTVPVPDRLGED